MHDTLLTIEELAGEEGTLQLRSGVDSRVFLANILPGILYSEPGMPDATRNDVLKLETTARRLPHDDAKMMMDGRLPIARVDSTSGYIPRTRLLEYADGLLYLTLPAQSKSQ